MKKIIYLLVVAMIFISGGCRPEEEDKGANSQSSGKIVLTQSHGDYPAAWGKENCSSCHPIHKIHDNALNLKKIVNEKGYDSCFGCHGDNGTGHSRPCLLCHNLSDLPEKPYLEAGNQHNFQTPNSYMTDSDCVICHISSDMDGQWSLNTDLSQIPDARNDLSSYQGEKEFCFRCHNDSHQQAEFLITGYDSSHPKTGIEFFYSSTDSHGVVDGTGTKAYSGLRAGYRYQSEVKCSDCHQIHATENNALILDHSKRGVGSLGGSFQSPGYNVATPDGNYAQLCVLCHVTSAGSLSGQDSGNGLSGLHSISGDCTACHYHGKSRF
ncbi:MAG: hypothetical protein GY786_10770 [Proteobacteria bacterium]|nr:hypothetical protein [Pseudomonadota bacterium]